MSVITDGGAAFPLIPPAGTDGVGYPYPESGMSLRDWFAGQYLSSFTKTGPGGAEEVARQCYKMADAMLAEKMRQPTVRG